MKGSIMKRFLLLLVCCSLLCGCGTELADDYEIESFDGESRFELSPESSAGEEGKEGENASFLVKDKKYAYGEEDFVILEVTNESAVDSGLLVEMTYFDEGGTVLGTEEKTAGFFSAGYQNNLCFAPGYAFETYEYSLSAAEYTSEHYETKVAVKGLQLGESMFIGFLDAPYLEHDGVDFSEHKKRPGIGFNYTYSNTAGKMVYVYVTFVLFNEKDEVIRVMDRVASIEPGWKFEDDFDTVILYITNKEKLEWPEKYQGEIRVITCFRDVTTVEP